MKQKLTPQKEEEEFQKITYSSRDVSLYREALFPYDLTNEQIDHLLDGVGIGATSAVEAKIADEVESYLKSLKK